VDRTKENIHRKEKSQMRKTMLVLGGLGMLLANTLCAQDIAGDWQGTLKAGSREYRYIVEVTKAESGGWKASIYEWDESRDPSPVDSVVLEGSNFKFTDSGFSAGKRTYEGKISADVASIEGAYTVGAHSWPLTLRRATKETVWRRDSYLFVWAGDNAWKASDFLAVIDANPFSHFYGQAVASLPAPGGPGGAHHTELEMPKSGFLLANAHSSGRTMLFDLREPLHPSLVTSFGGLNGYMHPHTYVRLPNNDVLATFQYHGGMSPESDGGGLVEVEQTGRLLRDSSAMDPEAKGELIRPYSVVIIPELDRAVSTNTAMMEDRPSRTVQVWRLSDLKLLKTLVLPTGPHGFEQVRPGEPRLLEDGKTVLIHTFSCGLYQLDGVGTGNPAVRYVRTFDGSDCGVPLRVGHYWIQTLTSAHAVVALDISDPANLREVSRVTFDDKQWPHWIAADADESRLVVDSGRGGESRIYILHFSRQTGALTVDEKFHDPGNDRPGIVTDGKWWPHGFHGDAFPHGAVFSRPRSADDGATPPKN
jgi:hypothetical protein